VGGKRQPERPAPSDLRNTIGRRIAELRAERGLSVSELARRVGVSASAISQIERGHAQPSVPTLFAVSRALDAPTDAFFSEQPPAPVTEQPPAPSAVRASSGHPVPWHADEDRYVVRRPGRSQLDCRGGVQWQRLTPVGIDGFEFLELIYPAHAESDGEPYGHSGLEFLVVTQGVLRISLGFEDHDLAGGDSITFPASTPHRYVNPNDEEARAITVLIDDNAAVPSPWRLRET
jgi:transcriptional regulator with XRE-family HTH domain